MWRTNRTFFGGLNLEQLLAYRKCGEKIALFLRSEPGTVLGYRKCGEKIALFFGGLNLEQVGYRKCGEKIALFLAV